jgi:hypothetical protein
LDNKSKRVFVFSQGKATRCMIYHNFELALEWLESQRAAMYDPTKRDLFLQWPNGTLYSRGSYPQGIGANDEKRAAPFSSVPSLSWHAYHHIVFSTLRTPYLEKTKCTSKAFSFLSSA